MPDQIISPAELERLVSTYQLSVDAAWQKDEISILSQLNPAEQEELCQFAIQRACVPGEIIFLEDEPGDGMYIIQSGQTAVVKGDLHAPIILGFRGSGGMIGEMALLENQPRSATVVALEPTLLLGISLDAFYRLSSRNPRFSLKMMGMLSSRLRNSDDQLNQVAMHARQRDEALEGLRDQVNRDPLTGLFNRRYLEVILTQAVSRARSEGTQVGILMLDVDHFKHVNDTYGHPAGDAVLQALAKLLGKCVRAEDVICRYGGEEFVVVMPGARRTVVQERAETIRQGFQEARVIHQNVEIAVTLSIGAALFPTHADTGESVLACADQALYQAKQTGRNRVVIA